jgi:predicted CoA-substrate-specific enzyme activase
VSKKHATYNHITLADSYASDRPVVGLDIGSRASKGAILVGNRLHTALVPTGLHMQETADALLRKLLRLAKVKRKQVAHILGTGYGRVSLSFGDTPYTVVTEISCHAMGAHVLIPEARTIVDIGGQDCKAIRIDPQTGKVLEFVMNDKCAAGTGRFLEKAAIHLGIKLEALGEVALAATEPAAVSSQCVVFAESELISLRARGEHAHDEHAMANIAAGVHLSAARRVTNLLGRIGLEPALVFTGGVSNNRGMWKALEELLGARFVTRPGIDWIFAGAVGAAVYAAQEVRRTVQVVDVLAAPAPTLLEPALRAIQTAEQDFIASDDNKKIGFLCTYMPMELLAAAGLRYTRLYQAGNAEVVGAGELHTQSVLCDHTKSCIGGFVSGHPLFRAVNKVYSPHVCGNMKRASEIIGTLVPTKLINVPKNRSVAISRHFFRTELDVLRQELEGLSGRTIDDRAIHEQIVLFNRVRRLLKKISELRLRPRPVLSGSAFLDLVRGYYILPPETLLQTYGALYDQLLARSTVESDDQGARPIRLLISGSLMADGDRRLLDIVERDLGAAVVVEDHCAGLRPVHHTIAEEGDPLQALADGYLDQAPCSNRKPMEDAIDFTSALAREYSVDGVLYVYLKFCSCYGLTKKSFIDRLQDDGLPVLDVSSDYSSSDQGQLKTRLEAFVEVLRERVRGPSPIKRRKRRSASAQASAEVSRGASRPLDNPS